MRRRLPDEPKQLLLDLASWIEWRYENSRDHVVLTSAPTSLPPRILNTLPGAVWRLAWLGTGSAILYGLAPSTEPKRYLIVESDGGRARKNGTFEKRGGVWTQVAHDNLEPLLQTKSSIRGRRGSLEPRHLSKNAAIGGIAVKR